MTLRSLTRGMVAAGVLTLGAGAWAQPAPTSPAPGAPDSSAQDNPTPATRAPGQMMGGQDGMADQKDILAGDDKDFVENATQGGWAEVVGSRMALEKSSNPDIKKFAEQMVQDHTKANEELAALAKKKGYTPPDQPSLIQRTKLKAMSVVEHDTFDKMYASQIGVSAHEDTIDIFQDAVKEVKDPDIKAFAQQTLPKLEEHLTMAKALQQKVDNEDDAKKSAK